jgi:hypothetical protein
LAFDFPGATRSRKIVLAAKKSGRAFCAEIPSENFRPATGPGCDILDKIHSESRGNPILARRGRKQGVNPRAITRSPSQKMVCAVTIRELMDSPISK